VATGKRNGLLDRPFGHIANVLRIERLKALQRYPPDRRSGKGDKIGLASLDVFDPTGNSPLIAWGAINDHHADLKLIL